MDFIQLILELPKQVILEDFHRLVIQTVVKLLVKK